MSAYDLFVALRCLDSRRSSDRHDRSYENIHIYGSTLCAGRTRQFWHRFLLIIFYFLYANSKSTMHSNETMMLQLVYVTIKCHHHGTKSLNGLYINRSISGYKYVPRYWHVFNNTIMKAVITNWRKNNHISLDTLNIADSENSWKRDSLECS